MSEIIKNNQNYIVIIGVEKTNRTWSDRIIKFCFDNKIEMYSRLVENNYKLNFYDYHLLNRINKTPIFVNATPMADVTDWETYYLMKDPQFFCSSNDNLINYFYRIFAELEYGVKIPNFSKTLKTKKEDISSIFENYSYDFEVFAIGRDVKDILHLEIAKKIEESELTYFDFTGIKNITPAILRLWHREDVKNLLIHYGKGRTYFYGNKTMCFDLVKRYGGVYSSHGDKAFCYLLKDDSLEKISCIISGMRYAV